MKKIERSSMRLHAYEMIKQAIITGDLAPERRVRDAELSELLGISRTPVREAILRLEDEAFIVSKPNSYTMVAPIDLEEVREAYTIVASLEALAVREIVKHCNQTDIKTLIDLNADYERALQRKQSIEALEADLAFHGAIVHIAKNDTLIKILTPLRDKIVRVEYHYFNDHSPKEKSYQEHERMIEAIQQKNESVAVQQIQENWMNSLEYLLTNYK
ncbi:GntR family transcriptional regulator [Geomicrobium sp. JCM 19039]|uniref:GntR family transcriptional regulator n=1 Tax=Geomicrobium sp. JCM 19039 TaxID=1460636 RepID=UPI00045F28D3|nr:GntR family transcriptional regulator [Geomicrobium sp. JCM 19039]GAK13374.1 transcriptional regulator, GntR family [Geomicrobium sp. JCM 19039]